MRKLIIFPFSYRNKSQFILKNFLAEPEKTLLIYPNYSKIKEIKKLYSRITGKYILPELVTVKTLACNLIEENSDKKIVDELTRFRILLEIVSSLKKFKDISIVGIVEGINNLVRDFKRSCEISFDYQEIIKIINDYEWKFEKNKQDLIFAIRVIQEYEKYLKQKNLVDIDDVYRESVKYIKYIKQKHLIIENFHEILPSQKNFFAELFNTIPDVVFSLSYDENIYPDVKELILEKTFGFLKEAARWEIIKVDKEDKKRDIECYNFPSQDEEVKGIARIILEKLKNNPDLKLNDIAIVCPDMPGYREVIKRIFNRCGISCELIPGYSLSNDSSVISLIEVLDFYQSYDWQTLMGILTGPYFKNINFEDVKKFSKGTRENYKGIGFTRQDFEKYKNEAVSLIKECIKILPKNEDTLENWVNTLIKIIEILNWQPPDIEIKNKFRHVIESLRSKIKVDISGFVNILKKCLKLVEVEQAKGEGLRVSGVIESNGIEKELVFIVGVTEENFPNAPRLHEIFIPDTLKSKIGLSDYKLRIARDRLDLYRLINENKKVIFTYPSKIGSKNQMKSIFLFNFPEKTVYPEEFYNNPAKIFDFNFSYEKFINKFLKKGKIKISVTTLQAFLACKYSFYLKHVEEIEPYRAPEIEEEPLRWGILIHSIMEKIFKKFENKVIYGEEIEDLVKEFEKELLKRIRLEKVSDFYKEIMKIRAQEVIKKFEKIICNHKGKKIVAVEFPVSHKGKNFEIYGEIDRLEEDSDGLYVIDIKTGTSALPSYTEKDFFEKGHIQIPAYVWLYKRQFNPGKEVYGSIWDFSFKEKEKDKNEKIYKKFPYVEEIDLFFEEICEEMIKGKIDFSPEENSNCFFCEYKTQCPK